MTDPSPDCGYTPEEHAQMDAVDANPGPNCVTAWDPGVAETGLLTPADLTQMEAACVPGDWQQARDNWLALARSHEWLESQVARSCDWREIDAAHKVEIARLREFGEHYSGAAQDAWDRIEVLEKALREIAEEQQKTLGWIQAHGIVFDGPLGTDPSNWENVAFSIYADLCEVDTIARAALAAASPGGAET